MKEIPDFKTPMVLNALFRVDGVRSTAPYPFEHLSTDAGDIWVYELLMYPEPLRLNEWCLKIGEQLSFLADVLSNTSTAEEKRSIHICTKFLQGTCQ